MLTRLFVGTRRVGKLPRLSGQSRWLRPFKLLLLCMLAGPLGAGAVVSSATPQAQSEVLTIAAQQPRANVAVIVQKVAKDQAIDGLIAQLGGKVTKDLHIINAVAAEVPASAVGTLSHAAGVRWVSLDAPVHKSGATCTSCINTANLKAVYAQAIGADKLWNISPYLQGKGITIAVVDSGIQEVNDLKSINGTSRLSASVNITTTNTTNGDQYGHGTHVAGIIGGNGTASSGAYIGIAPQVSLVNVKISNDQGMSSTSDVVNGLQWVNDHRTTYSIKVVNLSLNSVLNQSYNVDPLDAAAEILWFNGVVVVTSAGNTSTGGVFPPANDPFVITVGAMDDKGTASTSDDTLASFSSYGTTVDNFSKPDLVAPGTNIVSLLATGGEYLASQHPDHRLSGGSSSAYFRMSGTSMAAPMVSGAIALLLQKQPMLTPDQVKYRLKATATPLSIAGSGAGYVSAYAAAMGTTTASANTGQLESKLLWQNGTATTWNSGSWGSGSWGSASWGSASWGSGSWGSGSWGSDYWGP